MPEIIIIENEQNDVRFAQRSASQCGFSNITTPSAEAALAILDKARTEGRELPKAILLDLDLGEENGFEFLRTRYKTPWLMSIPLVVWTMLSDYNQDICGVFKVQGYVSKSEGELGLRKALEDILQKPSHDN